MSKTDTTSRRVTLHRPKPVDILRILVGAYLLASGIQYMIAQSWAMLELEESGFDLLPSTVIIPILTIILLVTGSMLILGLLTRTASAINLPVFAVFFAAPQIRDLPMVHMPLAFDVLMFFLLIFLAFKGSGPFSTDRYLRDSHAARVGQDASPSSKWQNGRSADDSHNRSNR